MRFNLALGGVRIQTYSPEPLGDFILAPRRVAVSGSLKLAASTKAIGPPPSETLTLIQNSILLCR